MWRSLFSRAQKSAIQYFFRDRTAMPRSIKKLSRKSRSRKLSPRQRAKRYVVKKVFNGDKRLADAFVREHGISYEEIRERWRPGDSVEFLAHSLWLVSQQRRVSAMQEAARNRSARTRIPLHEQDTEENAIPPMPSRQSRHLPSNHTFFG